MYIVPLKLYKLPLGQIANGNFQIGQIYTMIEQTVYWPICRLAVHLQVGNHSVNSQIGHVNLQMAKIYSNKNMCSPATCVVMYMLVRV